ncbi:S8 family serine peptidase [Algibacter miyuki]|uniref:S8 family serine peptidase n=1 Tax=Algibacter miyuki TaxID=1306933 RepID=A0ABV5H1J9_9FLAO|nr:S8 family serine peptidase [Algibacter miyuki]MDN3666216.1 S8 family serine peptidase [Algibacter miyuki]
MKKNILLFFSLSLISLSSIGQSDSERKNIIKNYDTDAISQLKEKLKINFLIRDKKISEYLKNNNTSNRSIKEKGKTYNIYDIVNGNPVYRTTHNLNSAKSTKTARLQTNGSLSLNLDGTNMNIGVWDEESVLGTHDEFGDSQKNPESRVVFPEFINTPVFGPISDHATHVAGTLIGKGADANAKGMAPKAMLRSFDWNNDENEALNEAANGLLISNHSYGVPIFNGSGGQQVSSADIGSYNSDARNWDEIAYTSPYYLAVNSAGNEGSQTYDGGLADGYDKLTGNKTAKNNLVVANANPNVIPSTGNLINFPINSSSSQGPTNDFRVKPDITGDGTNVYSSTSGSDSEYSTFSGTSMAAPNVAGTLILLQEYYNRLNSNYMRASTLKALVCHTAIDDPVKQGPDPVFGWGLLDAEASALLIQNESNGTSLIKELTLNNNATYTYSFSVNSNTPIKATICWTDPAGSTQSGVTRSLVNDLNVTLEDSNSNIHRPWMLDKSDVTKKAITGINDVDNVERIDISSATVGNYTLTVSHSGSLTNGLQNFSLILTSQGSTLDISKNEFTNSLVVWPNPTKEKLNIKFNSSSEKNIIKLYNALGQSVYQDMIVSSLSVIEQSINVQNIPKGIYFLNITSGNVTSNKKIIIE